MKLFQKFNIENVSKAKLIIGIITILIIVITTFINSKVIDFALLGLVTLICLLAKEKGGKNK